MLTPQLVCLQTTLSPNEGWENAQKQQSTNAARNRQNIRVGIKVEDVGKRRQNKDYGLLHIIKRSEVGSEIQSLFADRENRKGKQVPRNHCGQQPKIPHAYHQCSQQEQETH